MSNDPIRLQVLHLPAAEGEYPFALVIDRCREVELLPADVVTLGREIGARSVLVFESEVEIA